MDLRTHWQSYFSRRFNLYVNYMLIGKNELI